MLAFRRNLSAVITLLFVAPLVAEYLLGDLPLKLLPVLIVLAPFYGGAAVLIREIARRTGRGWPTILVLGTAYALMEEGLVTQSLFNHDYLKMHMQLLDHAYLPALGIGAWWTLLMVNLHTFWSVGVSVALVEALFPAETQTPWLSRKGDWVIAIVFGLGVAANYGIGIKQNHFLAPRPQLLGAAVLSMLLVVCAFLIPARPPRGGEGMVPNTSTTGVAAFGLGMAVLCTPAMWGWDAVAAILAIDASFLVLLTFLSRRTGWTARHTLSVAAGGALSYGIHAFTQTPLLGQVRWMRISNTVFLAAAIWLLWLAAKRVGDAQRAC